MPEISRFFGIIITMYYNDHAPPHFHARYGAQKARFAIDDLRTLDGNMNARAQSLVREWGKLHQTDLRREWDLAMTRKPLFRIEPLE